MLYYNRYAYIGFLFCIGLNIDSDKLLLKMEMQMSTSGQYKNQPYSLHKRFQTRSSRRKLKNSSV